MRLLLDTHILLWWLQSPAELGLQSRRVIETGDCAVSVVSFWELAAKERAGKVALPPILSDDIEQQGFRVIPLKAAHVEAYRAAHAAVIDPFDRMLLSVATAEHLVLGTRDGHLLSLGLKEVREL
ncbi:MAG: type II toxin-antitoxin system VapC family toxin [Betaproteobacteria bacterium]|nr:type II toxin-antitoxin system VapC family toxin [Betaproteobacteria bacterium]